LLKALGEIGTSAKLSGIRTKIILPYFLLTLTVASIGTFVVTNLVTSSLRERFSNQLVDAGRVVADSMVRYEEERLQTLRTVTGTQGVPRALADGNRQSLATLVPQIIANSNTDAVELISRDGREVYGWQRPLDDPQSEGIERSGADFSQINDVRLVLEGFIDARGDKRVLLMDAPDGLIVFTVGPVFFEGNQVGAAMVGTYVRRMMIDLTQNAVAHITLYDRNGRVIDTTLGAGQDTAQYQTILVALEESPERYGGVIENAGFLVPLEEVEVLDQRYALAYGDWRLRQQSFGLFSVALPSNFIFTAITSGRTLFMVLFVIATLGVFALGLLIAKRITEPVERLVQTAKAVAEGDLEQRSGIRGQDEIGKLAETFDLMTERLSERNYELLTKNSELEAILHGIVDGVIVLDTNDQIITTNPAAQQLLLDMSHDFRAGPLRELTASLSGEANGSGRQSASSFLTVQQPRRYQIGNRVLSTLAAPVETPEGEKLGTVVVLRDITREAEAEHLKDAFITSISHELRTPLTVIKVYADLMLKTGNNHLDERQLKYVQNINKGSEQLAHHINQLINISEIQAGTISLKKEPVNLPQLISEVSENWRERMADKGISLEIELPEEDLWLSADEAQLSWAIENLLSNAYHYTMADGRVEMRVFQEEDEARLDIADTGIGIAAADQPHVFERFFRASNEVNFEVRGVGLGLFITRSIIEMHDGKIWLESELGAGSTFSIALPLSG
jgi:signal transduction histidine kinase